MSAIEGIPDRDLERLQKLLNGAASGRTAEEAASFAAKAQELLERYNLDTSQVLEAKVGGAAREKAAYEGGFFKFQQYLWESVAEINFCLWWHQRYLTSQPRHRSRRENTPYYLRRATYGHRHVLVGKKVNVAATVAMAGYLEQAVERLVRERLGSGENELPLWGAWANSYRHGIVTQICRKLRARRNEALAEEQRRRDAEDRAADGSSVSNAVALNVYVDAETDANMDFLYGEGWSARRAAEAAERRARRAAYVKWAEEHPEEAAAAEARRRKQSRRGGGVGSRGGRGRSDYRDSSAYWAGYDAGKSVSIDPQAGTHKPAGLL